MEIEPILIVGTGAMASLFAAYLAAASIPVTMLGSWIEALAALRERGVSLVGMDNSLTTHPVRVSLESQDRHCYRRAVVLVKAWQTERVARQLVELLAPDGIVLTLQNGLGNREILAQCLGEARVIQGIVTMGATLLGPGRVKVGGEGKIALGVDPRTEGFRVVFRKAGMQVETSENLTSAIWSKLVLNSAINPLTAIFQVPNGALLSIPSARILLSQVAQETAGVAQALNISLVDPDPTAAVENLARKTAGNLSSMLQDVRRGAPTEIDAINGAIYRLGLESGTQTPTNHTLWLVVKSIVERNQIE